MKKITCIGLLLFNILLLSNTSVIAQKIPYMSLIDNKEMRYMDNTEISIGAWREYQYDTRRKYGENSKEFNSTIFDTIMFNKYYNKYFYYSTTKLNIGFTKEATKNKMNCSDYPMIGISYQQCIDFCKWRTEACCYKVKGVSKIIFSLPSKQDYEKAMSYAKITKNPPFSKLINKKKGKIRGINDNVDEYKIENTLNTKDSPIGFRCIATIVKK